MSLYSTDQRCPRCQYPNPPGAQTCANCGLALTSAPQSAYGSEPPPPPPPPYPAPPSSSPYGPPPGTGPYGASTGYGGGGSYDFTPQPPPPTFAGPPTYYPGNQGQPGFSGTAPTYAGSQPQPGYAPPGVMQQPVQQRSGSGMRIALIVLVVLIILGAGGGVAVYLLSRPKPAITVTSDYKVGSTYAGSTSTVLHVTGQKFSGSSNVTFLLDGQPAPDTLTTLSDNNGNIKADLKITDNWGVGQHVLTAKDGGNYVTQQGITLSIVHQGEAHTPGPNGAPTDDAAPFVINFHITPSDGSKGVDDSLTVTGTADAGKQVCNPKYDTNTPYEATGSAGGVSYTETYIFSCTGTYKGGKLVYTETTTKDQIVFSDKVVCTAQVPYVFEHLEGTFTSPTEINGNFSADAVSFGCTDGSSDQFDPATGTWAGTTAK